ncbi:MAG: type II toxin-antitoxin system PemK/MazF family toxin [Chloroflexi bacterium]|nr:type II toxin-antitoxin system PemK/MazF family toxin [Chloroflexota bacterium]
MPSVIRGDVYIVDWAGGRGSERKGKRPTLIIQNDKGNIYSPTTIVSTVIVAAITLSEPKPFPFMVRLDKDEGGLKAGSCINLAAIMTIDKMVLGDKLGHLSNDTMLSVDRAIKISLGLT